MNDWYKDFLAFPQKSKGWYATATDCELQDRFNALDSILMQMDCVQTLGEDSKVLKEFKDLHFHRLNLHNEKYELEKERKQRMFRKGVQSWKL